jgi:hypothetical protein
MYDRYFAGAITRTVAELVEGGVNARNLARSAERLGQLLHLDGADEEAARRQLLAVAGHLPPREAAQLVADGFRAGRAKPYTPKPASARNGGAAPYRSAPSSAPSSASPRLSPADPADPVERRVAQLEERVARIADALRLAAEGGR